MEKASNEPRCDYAIFPHVALRHFAFASPYMCLGALGAKEGRGFLQGLLDSVAEYCESNKREVTLKPEHFKMHNVKVKKHPCLIVEMPEPLAASEVFFVGIVVKLPPGDSAADLPNAEVRYFLLEKGPVAQATMFCEWTADQKHISHGTGPTPDLKKFQDKIAERIT